MQPGLAPRAWVAAQKTPIASLEASLRRGHARPPATPTARPCPDRVARRRRAAAATARPHQVGVFEHSSSRLAPSSGRECRRITPLTGHFLGRVCQIELTARRLKFGLHPLFRGREVYRRPRETPAGTILAIAAVMSPAEDGTVVPGAGCVWLACFRSRAPPLGRGLHGFVDARSRRCAESAPAPILRGLDAVNDVTVKKALIVGASRTIGEDSCVARSSRLGRDRNGTR